MSTPTDFNPSFNQKKSGFVERRKPLSSPISGLGKLPPQAVDLEEAVLGALMLEKDALTDRVVSAANIEFHARIVSQKYIQRELIKISSEIITNAYDETADIFDLLDTAEKSLFEVAQNNLRRDTQKIDDIMRTAVDALEKLRDRTDSLTGVPSGFTALDRVTSGWQPSDLVIIAARPAMGKTAFVLSCARNAAVLHDRPVAVFSLEMSSLQLVNRLISGETEIEQEKLKRGTLADHEWTQLHSRIGKLTVAPLLIDDTPALNVFEFRAKCRRLKAQYDIQMVIVDYLQLMHGKADGKGGNREQEIGSISRALKSVAKELNIPVIALSQLSRAVESRPAASKRPQLSDLRESGSIEQDADMVLFLYRPEYYGLTEDENGNSTAGIAEIIIAKHRNGELATVPLKFVGKFVKFQDLDDEFGGNSGTDAPSPFSAGMAPSQEFGNPSVITRSSKMNDDTPF